MCAMQIMHQLQLAGRGLCHTQIRGQHLQLGHGALCSRKAFEYASYVSCAVLCISVYISGCVCLCRCAHECMQLQMTLLSEGAVVYTWASACLPPNMSAMHAAAVYQTLQMVTIASSGIQK